MQLTAARPAEPPCSSVNGPILHPQLKSNCRRRNYCAFSIRVFPAGAFSTGNQKAYACSTSFHLQYTQRKLLQQTAIDWLEKETGASVQLSSAA
jgi:hypothetical protein